MKIAVVGLGLIGGSLSKALKGRYEIYGEDCDEVVAQAEKEGTILGRAEHLKNYDIVILCTPPKATAQILEEGDFKQNQIVMDFCGIKRLMQRAAKKSGKKFKYVGCHPMAGREVSGYSSSQENLFKGASLIIVKDEDTDEAAVRMAKEIGMNAGFTRFPICDADFHDRKIAYTSQLAHVVSGAYIKSDEAENVRGFTGGSFQDMTRVATLNEEIWKDLFMGNRDYLLNSLCELMDNLTKYRNALERGDEEELKRLLCEGSLLKKQCLEK